MPSAESKSASKNALPPALQELLVREAAFVLGRNRIGQAIEVAEDLKSAVARTRTWRSYIFRDKKNDHRAKRKELDADVEILKSGVKKFENTGPILYARVQRSLENYLREHDPEYANGLAASRFLDDWKRLLARFEEALGEFMTLLARLPTLFESIDQNQVSGTNPDARQLIDQAVGSARTIQEEIAFLNKIADTQRIRAGVDAITLYRQPERNWRTVVHSLHFSQPAAAVQQVRALVIDINDISEKVRSAIQGEIQLASYVVGYGVTSYHERVWASLREAAPLRIRPDDLETLLSETEDRIDEGRLEEWVPTRMETTPFLPSTTEPVAVSETTTLTHVSAPPPPKGPGLKLTSRSGTPPAPATAPTGPPRQAEDTVEDLMAERRRLEGIMNEMRASVTQREEFITQSEERLMQASQVQQEREMELEQREEQLRDLEKRLREKQGGVPAIAQSPKKPMDEFNE